MFRCLLNPCVTVHLFAICRVAGIPAMLYQHASVLPHSRSCGNQSVQRTLAYDRAMMLIHHAQIRHGFTHAAASP